MLCQCYRQTAGMPVKPVILDAAASVQAVAQGMDLALAVESSNTVSPAVKALLTSLARFLRWRASLAVLCTRRCW